MDRTADVVVIGGGIVGAATAYFLACRPGFGRRVTVIERDPSYAFASTTLSAASIRTQFSTAANIRLSRFGAKFLRAAPEALGVDPQFRERGYLLLASDAGGAALTANHRVQIAEGASVALLEPTALSAYFP